MLAQSALWLDKDCPQTRPVHRPAAGKIMLPEVGALQVSPPIYSRPAIVVRVGDYDDGPTIIFKTGHLPAHFEET